MTENDSFILEGEAREEFPENPKSFYWSVGKDDVSLKIYLMCNVDLTNRGQKICAIVGCGRYCRQSTCARALTSATRRPTSSPRIVRHFDRPEAKTPDFSRAASQFREFSREFLFRRFDDRRAVAPPHPPPPPTPARRGTTRGDPVNPPQPSPAPENGRDRRRSTAADRIGRRTRAPGRADPPSFPKPRHPPPRTAPNPNRLTPD